MRRPVRAVAPAPNDVVVALLREVLAGQAHLLQLVLAQAPRDPHATDRPLVDALVAAFGPESFVPGDAIIRAKVNAGLRLALGGCGIDPTDKDAGKLLGHRLTKLEGRVVGAYILERVKTTRRGVRRQVRVCGL